jgi:hypothetical protein
MTERSKEDTKKAPPCSSASPGIRPFAGREGTEQGKIRQIKANEANQGKPRQIKAN